METSNAASRLQALRQLMLDNGVHAYVVPTDDPHQSEYVAPAFNRREFISDFTGSAGTAVVTADSALLWTDGRYFAQANQELDNDYWTLMKDRMPDTVAVDDWLIANLSPGSQVGVDPYVLGNDLGGAWRAKLVAANMGLKSINDNLVDQVWGADRPALPDAKAFHHPLKYAGTTVREKVEMCQAELNAAACDKLVLAALDEVAWTLNVRGSDIPYNPVVISYVVIDQTGPVHWYVDTAKVDEETLAAVNEDAAPHKVVLRPYDALLTDLGQAVDSGGCRVMMPTSASLILHDLVPEDQKVVKRSPVALWKAVKNPAELEGLRQAHLRDAVALLNYFVFLEDHLKVQKRTLSEAAGSQRLLEFRQELEDFVTPSFATISSSGANGAIIHYHPPEVGSKNISVDEMYLLDSGGQFRDGTTDVTRTMHLGVASDHERRCFTRVLQGHIALDTCVFPSGITGYQLDAVARGPLWKAGLDYRHGTGHGVGAFLNVHEGPHGMSLMRKSCDDVGIQEGMTLSNEPGYYEEGRFGIRHENILLVRKADTESQFGGVQYLGFEHITYVPFQKNMMETSLMSPAEIAWVNNYHQECFDKVSPLLVGQDKALKWLQAATTPLEVP